MSAFKIFSKIVPKNFQVKILNTGFVSLGHYSDGPELKSDSLNVLTNPEVLVPSLGFGIIRSIDIERKLFYVITDLDDKVCLHFLKVIF